MIFLFAHALSVPKFERIPAFESVLVSAVETSPGNGNFHLFIKNKFIRHYFVISLAVYTRGLHIETVPFLQLPHVFL